MADSTGSFYYQHEGRYYPRATSVLDILREPGLEAWKERIGEAAASRIADRTSQIGTSIHRLVMQTLQGKKIRLPKTEAVRRGYLTWQSWWQAQKDFHPVGLEETLYSESPRLAGTVDCYETQIAGGPNRITDWKFKSAIYPSAFIQAHVYAGLVWQNAVPENTIVRIVRVDPLLGMVEVRERPFDPEILARFYDLLRVYESWYFQPAIAALATRGLAEHAGLEAT